MTVHNLIDDPACAHAMDTLIEIRETARKRHVENRTPPTEHAWRQPEVRALYDRWMADHYGEVDMELLLTAAYNAGARSAVTAMIAFGDLGPQLGRMESRIVSTLSNVRSVLDALTGEDR